MGTQFGNISTALGATETTETDLGDITVPSGASRITGISAALVAQTGTAAEGFLGHCRMTYSKSGTVEGVPMAVIVSEELGGSYTPQFTPCNLQVTALTKVSVFATATLAQTGTIHSLVCLRFE